MDKPTDKTALITDALWGIGEGIARTFACHDANLVLLGISPEIRKLTDELCGRGHRCTVVVAGVRDPTSVAAAIKYVKEKEGCIDIPVNNTGACRLGSFLDMNDDDRDFHIDINIRDIWNVVKAVLPGTIARKDGRIMMMSSVTGDMVADLGGTAYALTRATIVGLTKSLAMEYAQSGIRVSVICPGYVYIPMAESIARQSNPEDLEPVLIEMARVIPMRHLTDPPEVDELTAFLASDESSYLTGIQNVIDGGNTLPKTVNVGI